MNQLMIILLLFVSIIARGQSAEVEMDKGVEAYHKKDYVTAMEWFKKAADIGFPDAFYDVGLLYDHGFGVNKDMPEAARWYEKAAKLGQVSAMKQLSSLYNTGEGGVEKDNKKSFYWNKRLALLGDTLSTFNVGVMYLNEDGSDATTTIKGLDSAAFWFLCGIKAGAKKCNIGIQYTAIGYFDAGLAAYDKNDFASALVLYGKGAKLGGPEAMNNLGEMYYTGKGTKEDLSAAKYWLQKAAGLGFAPAIKSLADINAKPKKPLMVQLKMPDGKYVATKWDDAVNGFAKYTFPSGDHYEGMFKNGDFDGEGKLKWASGDQYIGTFVKGNRSGKGKQFYSDGTILYEGDWLNDAQHGTGTYYYPGGTKYIGGYENNQESGYGKLITGNDVYEGQFKNGQPNGPGKRKYNSDGTVYAGNYVNGQIQGSGTITYANGASETGNFVDNGPSGKWVFKGVDGKTEDRYFKSPGMYSVYTVVESKQDSKAQNDAYNAWWTKTYGNGGSQSSSNMNMIRQQKEQDTFDQRRQRERDESQRRIQDRERSWDRNTDNYNKKYGRY